MPRLTKRLVEGLQTGADGRDLFAWDDDVKGFGVRVTAAGRKVFLVRYRLGTRQRYLSLGVVGSPFTVEQAREKAREALRAVAEGRDPQREKAERRQAVTVGELIDLYLAEGQTDKPAKRASAWQTDASNLNRHVRPLLGKKLALEVSPEDVARLRADIEKGKTACDEKTRKRGRAIVRGGIGIASRVLSVLQAMFTWAERRRLIEHNPAKGVSKAKSRKLERFLSGPEVAKLLEALEAMEREGTLHRRFADLIRLLLFTGARRSEILGLRWAEVDLERGTILLTPERHKTGGKTGAKRIPLAPVARDLIARQPREGEFVFPALRGYAETAAAPSDHTKGLSKAWGRVRKRADLGDVRLHDLRHSFASFGVAGGESLYLIGKALGHGHATMTERYAHLADDPVRAAAERTAAAIQRAAGRDFLTETEETATRTAPMQKT